MTQPDRWTPPVGLELSLQRRFYNFCHGVIGRDPVLWERSDPEFWRDIFRRARDEFGTHQATWRIGNSAEICTVDREIIRLRAEKREMALERRQDDELGTGLESLRRRYGRRLAGWLTRELDAATEGLFYVDNQRVADCASRRERRYYRKCWDLGCCGFEDFTRKDWLTGREFRIGFNYGH